MSSIKVNSIKNTSTADGGIVIDGSGHVTVDELQMPTAGALSNRSLIINGAMQVAQRGTSAVTATGYPVDRWRQGVSTSGAVSAQYETTSTPIGFQAAIKCTVTTADATTDAGDSWDLQQMIEGYNSAQLLFGTANAKDVTVSFWARSSSAGTFCMTLLGASDGTTVDRSYVSEYTINSSNTWEYKTITVPGDTAGTWATNNGRGLIVRFGLTAGSNSQTAAGSWGAGNFVGTTNQTQLLETLNATFYISGVQLEVGSKATPFEHRSYGDEFSRCERYYQSWRIVNYQAGYSVNARGAGGWVSFHTSMRTAPGTIDTTSITYSNASGLSPQEPNEGGFGSYFVLSADGTGRCSYTFAADAEL